MACARTLPGATGAERVGLSFLGRLLSWFVVRGYLAKRVPIQLAAAALSGQTEAYIRSCHRAQPGHLAPVECAAAVSQGIAHLTAQNVLNDIYKDGRRHCSGAQSALVT